VSQVGRLRRPSSSGHVSQLNAGVSRAPGNGKILAGSDLNPKSRVVTYSNGNLRERQQPTAGRTERRGDAASIGRLEGTAAPNTATNRQRQQRAASGSSRSQGRQTSLTPTGRTDGRKQGGESVRLSTPTTGPAGNSDHAPAKQRQPPTTSVGSNKPANERMQQSSGEGGSHRGGCAAVSCSPRLESPLAADPPCSTDMRKARAA
jgi:hypothetical protein